MMPRLYIELDIVKKNLRIDYESVKHRRHEVWFFLLFLPLPCICELLLELSVNVSKWISHHLCKLANILEFCRFIAIELPAIQNLELCQRG